MRTREAAGPRCPGYLVGFDLRRRPHLEADVLVIGSGIAGCAAALAAADAGSEVLLLTKTELTDSNTAWAQGGIAAVLADDERAEDDSVEQHVADTLTAGAGLCDEDVVRDILGGAEEGIDFLRAHGCHFDANGSGVALTREGGHSLRRILHAYGDATGREISRSLTTAVLEHPAIEVVQQAFSIDLIRDDDGVKGVIYYRRDEFFAALAGSVILATGGCGRVFRETTNPAVATGDGVAMAYRAGAGIADMEFMQFHPTTLYLAGGARLLITEAMRGEGAYLKNHAGERFMAGYHELGELAPRDIVSQSIIEEIRRSRFPHVWLDATHLGRDFLEQRFPTIWQACHRLHIDISEDWIPVHPSAHYHCGGVATDAHGRTDIGQLFAAGEVACAGLHGANRLASNSLLEGLVVGLRAGRTAAAAGGPPGRVRQTQEHLEPVPDDLDVIDLARSLRSTMWRDAGIERTAEGLATATRSIDFWTHHQIRGFFRDIRGWELQNMMVVSSLIAEAASQRPASVGTHLRQDSSGEPDPVHLILKRNDKDLP